MTKSMLARLAIPMAVLALALSACSSSIASAPSSSQTAVVASAEMAASGAYITLADYEGSKDMYDAGTVVLFFHATWCPTCKATEENLNADPASIPEGLAIVKVDFDNSDDLRQQYGVTTQHTFVQVDADGNELAKWTGTLTAQDIDAQTV
jgi:thiol-disulfide isomerase/thioredoxin